MRIGTREAVSVYLEVAQKKALDALAKERKVPFTQIMRQAVDSFLATQKRRSP
jgi:predicted transcriptional regulator